MDALVTLLIFAGCAAVAISFSPIGSAVAARIRGRGVAGEIPPAVLAELDDLRARLAEMEERADFAERALLPSSAAPRTTNDTGV
jgi:hypothetical protein